MAITDGTGMYNQGGLTSDDVNRQYREEFVSKAVVEVAETLNKRYFSNRSNMENMPKNHGKKFTKMMHFPLINKDNMAENNLDGNTAEILQNVVYIVDANWVPLHKYDVMDYLNADTAGISQNEVDLVLNGTGTEAEKEAVLVKARAAAKAAADSAVGAGEKVVAGAGLIRNGYAPYAVNSGGLVPLPEEGGVVNLLNGTSKLISASITKHGIGTRWTMDSQNFTSWPKTINRKIKEISEAQLDIKELQVQYDLLDAAEANMIIPTVSNDAEVDATYDAINVAGVGPVNTLSFEAFEAFQQELMENEVPTDTTIISGTDKIDTKTIEEAYIVNCNREALPSLRRIVGADGNNAWASPAEYLAGSQEKLKGEIGAIKGLMFRFVLTPDLMVNKGQGLPVAPTGADNAAKATFATAHGIIAGTDDAATIKRYTDRTAKLRSSGAAGKKKIDVFNFIVIGDDCFNTLGFQEGSQNAAYIPPKRDNYNDQHGEIAGISTKWWHGTLVYRPERIRVMKCAIVR